ncbi:LysE family translocator [Shewanella violacea]|uniref:Transporter, LysE family n=1 Tax=Shewanella violacea (strain JCM 10179 / CIP 106290 / LMG 19151 / DSS12) TaxID=637905 RepID=D4ZL76_SHEVD|nr:LysE family translocator [Shewanella violacea]BAJ02425.1 transporter, LysE family [Shewanella violacea DSS12]
MEIISLAVIGILIVISPGADFVLVLKNSVASGRAAGLWTALGISLAIGVHIAYTLLGIGYLISHNEYLFNMVKYAGALYLIYIGLKSILTANASLDDIESDEFQLRPIQYLSQGFMCNVLNPKTMLFFVSLFSQLISVESHDHRSILLYGVYLAVLHGLWFGAVSVIFTSKLLQHRMAKIKKRLSQVCGLGLIGLGLVLGAKSL